MLEPQVLAGTILTQLAYNSVLLHVGEPHLKDLWKVMASTRAKLFQIIEDTSSLASQMTVLSCGWVDGLQVELESLKRLKKQSDSTTGVAKLRKERGTLKVV